jgi:hypothetical protein
MDEMKQTDNINRQHKCLFDEFDRWKPLFQDVRDFINPYIGFFDGEEVNSGLRNDEEMLRTMPIKYSHILAAGLQWGITSPTRPWVKFAFKNAKVMQSSEVLTWLNDVSNTCLDILFKGGFYPENHQFYLELGVFNTAAMLIEEDDETVINCRTFTIGEFAIGLDSKKRPNQFARNIEMTPFQIVEKFGIENVPIVVKNAYENKNYNKTMKVKHLICPNSQHDEQKIDNQSMKFSDYYWLDSQQDGTFLKKGGFNEFPVMVERYQTKGADIYGTGPGIWSLGDAKQIQLMWRDICTAAELSVKPAIQAPSDIMKNGGINMLPAGANYYNPNGGSDGKITTVFQPTLDMRAAAEIQSSIEECIKEHFNTKVFQLLSDMEKGTRTAREVIELSSEKMSQMGPLLERLQTGYLPQVINRIIAIGFRAGVFPPPPPEIEGMEMDIEYVSILSQAQKQYVITPIMDTVTSTIQMATTAQLPEILDKISWDEVVDQLGTLNGVPPSIIVSDEQVAAVRQARAEQQAQINAVQMGMTAADGAKTLSGADTSGNNALTQLLGGASGGLQQ